MARLLIKDGAQPAPLLRLISAAQQAAEDLGLETITITECTGGVHQPFSLHYSLRAIDIRSHDLPDAMSYVAALKNRLGKGYQVIFEDSGTDNEHIHAEYDPT